MRNPLQRRWVVGLLSIFFLLAATQSGITLAVCLLGAAKGDSALLTVVPAALLHPASLDRQAQRCLAEARDITSCGPLIHGALRANARSRTAGLMQALLLEQSGNLNAAEVAYQRLHRRDQSFQVAWAHLNFVLRNPSHGDLMEAARAALGIAPESFGAHYPLLLNAGVEAEWIVDTLIAHGRQAQTGRFLHSLADRHEQKAQFPALFRTAVAAGCRDTCRDALLAYVRSAILNAESLRDASALWELGLRQGLLPEQTGWDGAEPVLSYNPELRTPFLFRTFDWSAAPRERFDWAPAMGQSGIRVRFPENASNAGVLLARLIPEGACATELQVRTQLSANRMRDAAALVWELHPAGGAQAIASGRPISLTRYPAMQSVESRLPILKGSRTLELQLRARQRVEAAASDGELRIYRVDIHCVSPP